MQEECEKISEIISVRWLLLNVVTCPRGCRAFFPRAWYKKVAALVPPARRSRRFHERRYKKSPFASDPCGWSRINNDRMNFNTQLAFIPRAVIVEARERTKRRRVDSALLSKGQAASKDRWIDRSRYPRVRSPASPPLLSRPPFRSLAGAPRCRLTRGIIIYRSLRLRN